MGIFKNIKCIRNVICDIQCDMTVIREQLKIINETIINNIEVNDTSDLIIKCFKKDGYSLILKNVHINRK